MAKEELEAANVCAARAMRNNALETTVTTPIHNGISWVGLAEHTKVTAERAATGSLDIFLSFGVGKCHWGARNLFKLVNAIIILHRFRELSTKDSNEKGSQAKVFEKIHGELKMDLNWERGELEKMMKMRNASERGLGKSEKKNEMYRFI